MSTKTKAKPAVIPLTKWERGIVRAARSMGRLSIWQGVHIAATYGNIAKSIAMLTDNQRQQVFYGLSEFVALLAAMRGEN